MMVNRNYTTTKQFQELNNSKTKVHEFLDFKENPHVHYGEIMQPSAKLIDNTLNLLPSKSLKEDSNNKTIKVYA